MTFCMRRREFIPRRIMDKCFKYKDNSGNGRGGCTPACTRENRRGGTWEDVGGLKVGGPPWDRNPTMTMKVAAQGFGDLLDRLDA